MRNTPELPRNAGARAVATRARGAGAETAFCPWRTSPFLRRLQGKLAANCWLLSAIACLTEYQDALPVLFADRGRALQEVTKARAPSAVAP